ncbi:MAG: Ig-like domain-containing protein [Propionibacteriaceae bacterium]
MPVTRRQVVGFIGASSAIAVAGCGTAPTTSTTGPQGSASAAGASSASPTPTAAPPVQLTASVAQGATVPVDTQVVVTASSGTISDVAMTFNDPKAGPQIVQGTLSPDAAMWTAGSLLEPGMAYKVDATAHNRDGVETMSSTSFTAQALSLKHQIFPTIVSGGNVGVAMPVVVTFDVPVTDKAAFQKRMTVTATPAHEGTWSWQSSTQAHWRPKELWTAGTQVAISVDINSVAAGNGTYGQKSVTGTMTIGRSVILNCDLASHYMTVVIDGAVARKIPITGGKPGFVSRSGKKVLKEKFASLRMNSETVGIDKNSPEYYDLSNVQYAMRETDSGEFIHAAPWSVGSQGRANVSHGCIGVSTANGSWLFSNCKVGDLINVIGTSRTLEKGNGWTDWNVSYEEFAKGSAL